MFPALYTHFKIFSHSVVKWPVLSVLKNTGSSLRLPQVIIIIIMTGRLYATSRKSLRYPLDRRRLGGPQSRCGSRVTFIVPVPYNRECRESAFHIFWRLFERGARRIVVVCISLVKGRCNILDIELSVNENRPVWNEIKSIGRFAKIT